MLPLAKGKLKIQYMCYTDKAVAFKEAVGKDVDELQECCDNDMSTDKLEQLPKVCMALTKLNMLKRIIMIKKQQSVK
jgi:hypothetical protein